jgi:hypothetical protein
MRKLMNFTVGAIAIAVAALIAYGSCYIVGFIGSDFHLDTVMPLNGAESVVYPMLGLLIFSFTACCALWGYIFYKAASALGGFLINNTKRRI